MVRVATPVHGLGVIVVAADDGPHDGRVPQRERRRGRAGDDEGDLVDAQELFVGVLVGGALAPDVFAAQVRVAQVAGGGEDGLLAQQVGPDDEGRVGGEVRGGPGEPGLGERAVVAHGLEADDGVAVDLLVRAGVAKVAALAASGEQAIGRVGVEQGGAGVAEGGPVALGLARVGADAAQGFGRQVGGHRVERTLPGMGAGAAGILARPVTLRALGQEGAPAPRGPGLRGNGCRSTAPSACHPRPRRSAGSPPARGCSPRTPAPRSPGIRS